MNKDQEYNGFMAKLFHKAREIDEDYNNLSPENKIRVNNFINDLMRSNSFLQNINYLATQYSCRNVIYKKQLSKEVNHDQL